jgi:hypothetical protein
MSPHILIDVALEGLADDDCPPGNEVLVQKIITGMLTDCLITIPEFHHYCERLVKILRRRGRLAA